MRVVHLKRLVREHGLRGYSRLNKAELIVFIQNNSQTRTRPPRPTRPPPPPPQAIAMQVQLVRFRPDRPRQPELLRKLNSQPVRPAPEFKPYQLKPKKGTNVEPPVVESPEERPTDPKKLKRMKKKLDELNRKIRHSRKKHDGLIHKQNSLRKAIEELKRGNRQAPIESRQGFIEHEQAFRRAYRSYRVNDRPGMDVDTFFSHIRGELISLITREVTDLNSARVQMTTWIRFMQDDD